VASSLFWVTFMGAGSQYMVYLSGEIKNVKRNLTWSLIMNMVILLVVISAATLLFANIVDPNFYGSLSFLWLTGNSHYPVPGGFIPSPQFIGFLIKNNAILTAFITFASVFSVLAPFLAYLPWISRVLFAMSFDRMLPSWMSSVNQRFYTPVKAIIIVTIGSIISLVFWVSGYASTLVNGTVITSFIWLIAGIACMVFPFTMKDVFNSSPFNKKIGAIPIISIAGIAMILSWLVILWSALTNPALGVLSTPVYTFVTVLFVSGLAVYFGVRAYRKSHGLNIDLIFKEVPPE
jgi:amino acid transporter